MSCLNYGVWNKMPNELYVIGDIHGDFFALKQSLELTGCVNFNPYNDKFKFNKNYKYYYLEDGCNYYSIQKKNVKWNVEKKNCFIVFSGDIFDRCRPNPITNINCINTVSDENCDLLLLQLLFDLDEQAKLYGSRVIVVLGNHEIMNIQNDIRYVSLKGRYNNRINEINQYLKSNLSNIYGIIRINKYIIVHGGVNDLFFYKLNKSNKSFKSFESIEIFNYKLRYFLKKGNISLLNDKSSPFWDRKLGGFDYLNENQCDQIFLNNILKIKNFNEIKDEMKIIVAHCPQFTVNQTINLVNCQKYENRIWRIDVGMSRAFDLYNMDKIKNELNNNKFNLLSYKDFFTSDNQTNNRVVSCIKLTEKCENILKGKLTIDYFYDQEMFKLDKIKLLHILYDLIKIFIDNYNKNYQPTELYQYIIYIHKLKDLVKQLSK